MQKSSPCFTENTVKIDLNWLKSFYFIDLYFRPLKKTTFMLL